MRVCVFGLWHLGCVTAACLARGGHDVVAVDPDRSLIDRLRNGEPPLYEPGLQDIIRLEMATGRLQFASDPKAAAADADILWITFDTPVDEDDVADVQAVIEPVSAVLPGLADGCLVLVSSQVPVGTTRRMANGAGPGRNGPTFGYSPENLRLGHAIDLFMKPDRVVVGLQSERDRSKVAELLAPFTTNIIWMGLEAAEMTKHAINAFLGMSVAFMNEIAAVCEAVGADAQEVERGLKSEDRIGPKAYLSPGGAFAGGTLARDITTLIDIGRDRSLPLALVPAVRDSNNRHRGWAIRKLEEQLGSLSGRRVAILGLTYKPGTSALRRSSAIELAAALRHRGASVVAFDPAVRALPDELVGRLEIAGSAAAAAAGASALVLATPWLEFRDLDWVALLRVMAEPRVIDANGFLMGALANCGDLAYAAVGRSWESSKA